MRVLLVLIASILFFSCVNRKAVKKADTPIDIKFGYKDIKLEQPITAYNHLNLSLVTESKKLGIKTYLVNNEKYQNIGDVKIDKVEISTFNDSVYTITLTKETTIVFKNDFFNILSEGYGKGDESDNSYTWVGNKVIGTFYYVKKNNAIYGYSYLDISSLRLSNRVLDEYDEK